MWKTLTDKVKKHKCLTQEEIFSTKCFFKKSDLITGLSDKTDISKLLQINLGEGVCVFSLSMFLDGNSANRATGQPRPVP